MRTEEALGAHAALVLAAVAFGAAAQGGFYRNSLIVIALLLAGAAATVWLRAKRNVSLFAPEISVFAFGGWALVAGSMGGSSLRAVSTLVVALCVGAVLICMRRIRSPDRLAMMGGIAGVGALVALSGIAGVAFHREPFALPSQGLWRAATTLTYANAAGCLLAVTTFVAIAVSMDRRTTRTTVVATLNMAGLAATFSRGAIAAFVVGIAVWLLTTRDGEFVRRTLVYALGAAIVVGALGPSLLESGSAQPLYAVAGLVTGAGVAVVVSKMKMASVLALVAVLGIAAGIAVTETDAGERVLDKRLNIDSPVRVQEARAALRVVAARPLTGAGPGRAPLVWNDPASGELLVAEFAHNEYLQVLADTGVVGGALAGLIIVLLVRVIVKGRDSLPTKTTHAAAAAGLAAFLAQSVVDFVWHVPVLPILVACVAGMCLPLEDTDEGSEESA